MDEALMQRYYATYNSDDPEALAAFYHPQCTLTSSQEVMQGRDAILETYRYLIGTFEDRMSPVAIVIDGDSAEVEIIDRFTARNDVADFMGQSLAMGESFELRLKGRYRAEDGQFREIHIGLMDD